MNLEYTYLLPFYIKKVYTLYLKTTSQHILNIFLVWIRNSKQRNQMAIIIMNTKIILDKDNYSGWKQFHYFAFKSLEMSAMFVCNLIIVPAKRKKKIKNVSTENYLKMLLTKRKKKSIKTVKHLNVNYADSFLFF